MGSDPVEESGHTKSKRFKGIGLISEFGVSWVLYMEGRPKQ